MKCFWLFVLILMVECFSGRGVNHFKDKPLAEWVHVIISYWPSILGLCSRGILCSTDKIRELERAVMNAFLMFALFHEYILDYE